MRNSSLKKPVKLAICSTQKLAYSVQVITPLLRERGIKVIFKNDLSETNKRETFDLCWYRCAPEQSQKEYDQVEAVALELEARGARPISTKEERDIARSKIRNYQVWQGAGVLEPLTFLGSQISECPDSEVNNPWIAKPNMGSRGQGIKLFDNIFKAEEFFKKINNKEDYIVQKFLKGETIRIVASGKEAFFAYKKVSDDPVASISKGSAKTHLSSEELAQYSDLAIKAAAAVGGSAVGLDFLKTDKGVFALEANSSFALYGNNRKDLKNAGLIADWIKGLAN